MHSLEIYFETLFEDNYACKLDKVVNNLTTKIQKLFQVKVFSSVKNSLTFKETSGKIEIQLNCKYIAD